MQVKTIFKVFAKNSKILWHFKAYDDLIEKDQDIEDKYFEENSNTSNEGMASLDGDSQPDELDLYMKEVDKELKLKKKKSDQYQEEYESDWSHLNMC